jgi:hypothetical protein
MIEDFAQPFPKVVPKGFAQLFLKVALAPPLEKVEFGILVLFFI